MVKWKETRADNESLPVHSTMNGKFKIIPSTVNHALAGNISRKVRVRTWKLLMWDKNTATHIVLAANKRMTICKVIVDLLVNG